MVQISRSTLSRRSRAFRRGVFGLFRFLLLSAVVPLLFLARFWWTMPHPHDIDQTETQLRGHNRPTAEADKSPAHLFAFLQNADFSARHNLLGSDVVELYHCRVPFVMNQNFTRWAYPILNSTVTDLKLKQKTPLSQETLQDMQQEFILELVEFYASSHGFCDYNLYHPTVPPSDYTMAAATRLQNVELADDAPDESARLAFSIVAYQDIDQLQRLVNAIHMPHHYIIIHLERRIPAWYETAVQQLAQTYDNVAVLKFGSVIYKTDSVSLINLRIMQWITNDLQLSYDYFLTLGGAAYPLQSASTLANRLYHSERPVWLGALTHKGVRTNGESQVDRLRHKRLIYSRGNDMELKLHHRLPLSMFSTIPVSEAIQRYMRHKTNSGNQAIYSYETVRQLLDSSTVMELFALSKYGCCCCLEERNWIAALGIIGYQKEALEQSSMWQVWGGAEKCQSSMKNVNLSRNASLCYRLEDATANTTTMYIRGNQTWEYLLDAKRRGFLFARKFSSDDPQSMALLQEIEETMWDD